MQGDVAVLDAILLRGDEAIRLGQGNIELDSYQGPVLIASGGVLGEITGIWVNWGAETRMPVPASVVADGRTFEIGISGMSTGSLAFVGGMEVTVTDPDGIVRATPPVDWVGISPGQEFTWEYNISRVDKPGTWTCVIRFLARE